MAAVVEPEEVGTNDTSLTSMFGRPSRQRWHVLIAFGLSYGLWNWAGSRYTPIASTAARYHGTTNDVDFASQEIGIDFISMLASLCSLSTYLPAAYVVDRYGIFVGAMFGNVVLCLTLGWGWYIAGDSWNAVIALNIIGNLSGTFQSTSLIAISNRWFPPNERALATAIGTFFGLGGYGLSTLASAFYTKGPAVVDLCMKSCAITASKYNRTLTSMVIESTYCTQDTSASSFVGNMSESPEFGDISAQFDDTSTGNDECFVGSECSAVASDSFCCFTPIDIPTYNLHLALLLTLTTIYSFCVTRDRPPYPVAPAGELRPAPTFIRATRQLFSTKRWVICTVAEVILAGPIGTIYATMDRILPASVQHLDWLLGLFTFFVLIPMTWAIAGHIDRKKNYFDVTRRCYCVGVACVVIIWMSYEIGGTAAGYLAWFTIGVSVCFLVCWQVLEYELKTEYTFTEDFNTEGFVMGWDRFFANLGNFVFVAMMPPEKFPCPSAKNFMRVAVPICLLGASVFIFGLRNVEPRRYLRLEFERKRIAYLPSSNTDGQAARKRSVDKTCGLA